MDATLIAALEGVAPVEVLLVTITLPSHVVRWTDGGFVAWGDQTYTARDPAWGVLSSMGPVEDGIDSTATNTTLSIYPPDGSAFAGWCAPGVQGSPVARHLGVVDRVTGLLIGEPDLLDRLELDQPSISGTGDGLDYSCITEEARMLEANDERRLTDTFTQSVWPGDLGCANVTALPRKRYWRASNPNNAIT